MVLGQEVLDNLGRVIRRIVPMKNEPMMDFKQSLCGHCLLKSVQDVYDIICIDLDTFVHTLCGDDPSRMEECENHNVIPGCVHTSLNWPCGALLKRCFVSGVCRDTADSSMVMSSHFISTLFLKMAEGSARCFFC